MDERERERERVYEASVIQQEIGPGPAHQVDAKRKVAIGLDYLWFAVGLKGRVERHHPFQHFWGLKHKITQGWSGHIRSLEKRVLHQRGTFP